MKRILPLTLVLSLGVYAAFGCSNSDSNDPAPVANDPNAGTGQPGTPGNPGNVSTEDLNTNPVEGLEPATVLVEMNQFTDGPVWQAQAGVLVFSTPLNEGALWRALPDGRVLELRKGSRALGTTPIGNTINAAGEVVTAEAKRLVRSPVEGGEPTVIALNYVGATPPADAGPVGDGTFDTLNDVVARKDGTLYVTDPGYFGTPAANRIYRIDPTGAVQVVEAFDDVPRPNGIALSPDEKTLYVGFEKPVTGTLPFIRKYIVNDDGTLGEWTKFVDIGPAESSPDGLAVDKVGNVYVATKAGIEVYKASGQAWGTIPIPEKPTGMTFGGPDMKTLFVTSEGMKVWQLKAKLAGLSQ